MKSVVVVPTYNERENLGPLVGSLHAIDPDLHVLVVDDESPDGTGEIADDLAAKNERVRVIHRSGPRGLGLAYRDGFAAALDDGADIVVQMDCDFSHDPAVVPRLVGALSRADLVLGSRYCRGGGTVNWGLGRRLLSRGGSFYARMWLGIPANDLTGGFKAWRRDILRRLRLDRVRSEGYGFQVEMTYRAHRAGARIREVPILFADRRVGESKMSGAVFTEAVLLVPRLALGLLR